MHELEQDLVHDGGECLLDPGDHVAAHAHFAPRIQRDGAVVGRDELGLGRADSVEGENVQPGGLLAVPEMDLVFRVESKMQQQEQQQQQL